MTSDGAASPRITLARPNFRGREASGRSTTTEQGRLGFATVVLPHLDDAYNLARSLMRNAAEAEDVVQEAMLRALKYFRGFEGTNARAWVLQIVRNAAYAALRKRQDASLLLPLEHEDMLANGTGLTDPSLDPEALLATAQDRERLAALLAELPVILRECIILRDLNGFSYREIAALTDIPTGTVMSRLWRARRMLTQLAAKSRR